MEKIAVDLEKLLDDFEFHEEQRIDFASKQSTLNGAHLYKSVNSSYVSYPHRDYERSSFEPINLTGSDFAAVASPPSPSQTRSAYSLPNGDSEAIANAVGSACRREEDVVVRSTSDRETLQLVRAFKSKEFKPDLIESNSNSDICSSLNEFNRFERHLPDIASTDVDAKVDEKANLDLITNSVADRVEEDVSDVETPAAVTKTRLERASEGGCDKSSKMYENAATNKLFIQVPSAIGIDNNYKETNQIEITDERGEAAVVAEKETVAVVPVPVAVAVRSAEASERTSLNLNTCTGSVAVVEIVDESNCEDDETESSLREMRKATADADDTSVEDDDVETVDRIGCCVEQLAPLDSSYSRRSVATDVDVGECVVVEDEAENEESIVPDKRIVHDCASAQEEANDAQSECSLIDETRRRNGAPTAVDRNDHVENRSENDPVCTNEVAVDSHSRYELTSDTDTDTDELHNLDAALPDNVLDWSAPPLPDSSQRSDDSDDAPEEMNAAATAAAPTSQTKAQRPDSLNLMQTTHNAEISSTSADSGSSLSLDERRVGKEPPVWIPDSESSVCMHCQTKFTLVRRRHHCRACGLVLCSKCCDLKANLEYLKFEEARVCHTCYNTIEKANNAELSVKRPNPNNPMEYCSTIPPLLQVGPTQSAPPSVLVPVVGVLKREGRSKTNDTPKQVIFSDGIRPGGDLTELDAPSEPRLPLSKRHGRVTRRVGTPPGNAAQHRRTLNPETRSFIPSNRDLPPLIVKKQGEFVYAEMEKPSATEDESFKFAINRNLFVLVKRITLDCCVNRQVWCMTTEGLSCVGQDEIVFILEMLPDEKYPPKDVFSVVNMLYQEASKGCTVTELSFASAHASQLFDSKEHGGFVFVRPTYQCVQKLLLPQPPFLVALLIHKWEAPWARLFPVRLILRLGAEFRYYPCPLVSVRDRPALFTDVGNTIIGLLADFRKYSYSLPTVRGLMIHMEDRLTTILLPRNRYDQVIRAMNNSGENVLAFAGNISTVADSHLVCIQSVENDISYHTQAINIHSKPRQITGASFVVFNGSLKQCSWTGKSNIVEDGLMVQIPSESMAKLRAALRQMNDYCIGCGPHSEERVVLKWAPDDVNFNIGVKSQIDNRALDGVPSIRVHNGTDYSGTTARLIRWTEVFILQSDEDSGGKTGDTVNISKLSESIARATCIALVPLLDLLATANLTTIAVRATIHPEKVGYEAGSGGEKLRPLYMKRLDNELIAVVHEAAVSIRDISCPIVLELIFKIMEQVELLDGNGDEARIQENNNTDHTKPAARLTGNMETKL